MLTVILWLWQAQSRPAWGGFKPAHVNRAARMIRNNLTLQHEIVCITDLHDAVTEFDPEIRLVPIWSDHAERGRCWRRLKAFAPGMEQILGERWAWIDLDCVVMGDLTPLFERDEDLVLWRSQSTRNPYNGSMVLHRAGTMPEIWQQYRPQIDLKGLPGSDQAWLAHLLGSRMPVWTDRDGVYAYNRYGRRWRKGPPPGARIMFFPGSIKSNSHICLALTPWVQGVLNQYGEFDEKPYQWSARMAQRARRLQRFHQKRAGVLVRQ